MSETLRAAEEDGTLWPLPTPDFSAIDGPYFEITDHPVVSREIRAQLVRSWRLMLRSKCKESLLIVGAIALRLDELDAASRERYKVQLRLIRAVGDAMADDPAGVLSQLGDPVHFQRDCHLTRLLRRFAYWRLGRWPELYSLKGAHLVASSSDTAIHAFDLTVLASASLEKLQLITAWRLAADAIAVAQRHGKGRGIAAASAAMVLASVHYELGHIDQAEELVLSHLPTLRARGMPDAVIRAYWLLSRVAQSRARYAHAAIVLDNGQRVGEQRSCPRIVVSMMGERVRLQIACNDIKSAHREAEAMTSFVKNSGSTTPSLEEIADLCILAQLRIQQAWASGANALQTLKRMVRSELASNRFHGAFCRGIDLAEALSIAGAECAAERVLIRLLEIGERNGLLQCWLDAGPVSKALLVRIARCLPDRNSSRLNPLEPYLRTILTHQAKSATGRKKRSWQSTSLSCERLSAKERAVLGLVAKGRSNKHIARTLQVTTETVKTHLKRAFIKLGARTRAEAVSRAGDFGQLFEIAVLAMPAKEARHPLG